MKILLVGNDVGAALPLSAVERELIAMGDGCTGFYKEAPMRELIEQFTKVDFVLTGVSSSPALAEYELQALAMAKANKIPFGLFADIFGAWRGRKWFEDFKPEATIFVLNEEEAAEAKLTYPTANVVASGSPRWADFFKPNTTRAEVRAKLGVDEITKVVLVPSGKTLEINTLHFDGVVKASKISGLPLLVVISIHPGIKDDDLKNQLAVYEREFGGYPFVRITTKEFMSADDLVPGTDIVVQSASTVGVTASCQRIPVVNFFNQKAIERLAGNTGGKWEPVEKGAELEVVEDVQLLANQMDVLTNLSSSNRADLVARQKAVYHKPFGKSSAKLIADTIRGLVSPKK